MPVTDLKSGDDSLVVSTVSTVMLLALLLVLLASPPLPTDSWG